jgi:hypothetical protein
MSTRRRRLGLADTVRDTTLFVFGLGLMGWQGFYLPKSEFNWVVFSTGLMITQAPGAMAMIGLIRTVGQSSPEALAAPPSPRESPLPADSGE